MALYFRNFRPPASPALLVRKGIGWLRGHKLNDVLFVRMEGQGELETRIAHGNSTGASQATPERPFHSLRHTAAQFGSCIERSKGLYPLEAPGNCCSKLGPSFKTHPKRGPSTILRTPLLPVFFP